MGMGLLQLPDDLEKRRQCWTFDDFEGYVDAVIWTKGTTGTGTTVTNPDGNNGILSLGNAASTANAEAWVASTRKNWKFITNTELVFETSLAFAEANTNNCCVFAGFSSSLGATGALQASTGIPPASFSGAGFYLPQGLASQVWYCVTSVGGTQLTVGSIEAAAVGATTFQTLRVEVKVVGSNVEVDFLVGNREVIGGNDNAFPVGFQQAREGASGFQKPIKHRVAFSGAATMAGGVYLRQVGTTSETVQVDYIGLLNLRA